MRYSTPRRFFCWKKGGNGSQSIWRHGQNWVQEDWPEGFGNKIFGAEMNRYNIYIYLDRFDIITNYIYTYIVFLHLDLFYPFCRIVSNHSHCFLCQKSKAECSAHFNAGQHRGQPLEDLIDVTWLFEKVGMGLVGWLLSCKGAIAWYAGNCWWFFSAFENHWES